MHEARLAERTTCCHLILSGKLASWKSNKNVKTFWAKRKTSFWNWNFNYFRTLFLLTTEVWLFITKNHQQFIMSIISHFLKQKTWNETKSDLFAPWIAFKLSEESHVHSSFISILKEIVEIFANISWKFSILFRYLFFDFSWFVSRH